MSKLNFKPSVLSQKIAQTASFTLLSSAAAIFAMGCTGGGGGTNPNPAPSDADIFEPNPNTNFGADTGSVTINALAGAVACYTTDGSTPSYNNGSCSGGTTEEVNGAISLSCGDDDNTANTLRSIAVSFEWEGVLQNRSANFTLDCTPPPADTDNDGVIDNDDNCPNVANPDQADSNNNGIGDACEATGEPDADNDGRPDTADNCVDVWNVNQADNDNDGIGNVCDATPEGEPQLEWANPDLLNLWLEFEQATRCEMNYIRNGNSSDCSDPSGLSALGSITYNCANGGTTNWTNTQTGFKGRAVFTYTNCEYALDSGTTITVSGSIEGVFNSSGTTDQPGTVGSLTISGDGWSGAVEDRVYISNRVKTGGYYTAACTQDPLADKVCAPNNAAIRFNAPNWDCDGNVCPEATPPLPDADNDGVFDAYDNCPNVANPDQANIDFDALGDACDDSANLEDADLDGVLDSIDNCPNDANPDQADADNDGLGDVCDAVFNPDADEDGVNDDVDNCPNDVNADQADADNDGLGDVCDATPNGDDPDGDGVGNLVDNCPNVANPDQADFDQDGLGDACDAPEFHMLQVKSGGCLVIQSDDDAEVTTCNVNDNKQRFVVTQNGSNFVFRNVATDKCLNAYTSWAIPYANVANCNGSSAQNWTMSQLTGDVNFPSELKNGDENFCIYGDEASGTLGNCGLADADKRRYGIYPDGNFDATPIQP